MTAAAERTAAMRHHDLMQTLRRAVTGPQLFSAIRLSVTALRAGPRHKCSRKNNGHGARRRGFSGRKPVVNYVAELAKRCWFLGTI
jgi:hypothetical protein